MNGGSHGSSAASPFSAAGGVEGAVSGKALEENMQTSALLLSACDLAECPGEGGEGGDGGLGSGTDVPESMLCAFVSKSFAPEPACVTGVVGFNVPGA